MTTSTCIVASCGPPVPWETLAARATASAAAQTRPFTEILRLHRPTASVAEVRNRAAHMATSEWLCFLDADDELDPAYNLEMMYGAGDVRWPAVSYDDGPAGLLEHGDLERANYIVIGAFIRRDAFIALAGFREMDVLEDWDLWLRAQRAGLLLTPVPGAVYRVHSREGSRNYGGHGNP